MRTTAITARAPETARDAAEHRREQGLLRICSYDHGGYIAWGWWKGWDGDGGLKDFIRRSIQRLDRFPKLKWGFHIEGATWDWVLENDPAFAAEFKTWVDDAYAGRISLSSGGYGQPLSCTIGEEANIRHLVYDREAYDRLGCQVRIYMQNEHGFFPQMPQLLRGVGIDKAILRTIWGMYGICPEIDASKIRWRSPDGSWVEAIPTYVGGNRGLGKNAWDTRIIIGLEGYIDFEPFRRYCLDRGIQYPVAVRIDDYPLPYEHDGSGGFGRLCSFSDKPGYRWVTGEEAFAEIPLDDVTLDTGIDDYPIQMPWGYMGNIFWNLSRRAETALLTAERLAAINAIQQGATWEGILARAWRTLLIAQHHDINICGVSSGGEHGELMVDAAKRFYGKATDLADTVVKANLRAMLTRFAAGRTDRVIVAYNPLNWTRRDLIVARVKSDKRRLPAGFRVTLNGKPLAFQVLETETAPGGYINHTTLVFSLTLGPQAFSLVNVDFLDDEPPSATRRDCLAETEGEISVQTDWGSLRVDRGTGEYLAFDPEGRPLLVPHGNNGLLTAKVDGRYHTSVPKSVTVAAQGPVFIALSAEGYVGPLPYTTEVVVYLDRPRLDFRTRVEVRGQTIGATDVPAEWEGKDEPVVQDGKLMVHFTPALTNPPVVVQDFPFSIGETRHREINAANWVDVSDGERGLTLSNRGTMGYIWDGRTLSNILLYSGKYSWGEVQAFLDGEYTLEYSVMFHPGDWRAGQAHRAGLEYNFPFAALAGTPREGSLSPSEVGLAVVDAASGDPCPNLIVSAFYTKKGRPYLRLYEFLGLRSTAVRVILDGRPVRLIPVNLLHEAEGEETETAAIPAFGIKTFRLVVK